MDSGGRQIMCFGLIRKERLYHIIGKQFACSVLVPLLELTIGLRTCKRLSHNLSCSTALQPALTCLAVNGCAALTWIGVG